MILTASKCALICFWFFLFVLQFSSLDTAGYVGFANLPNQVHRKSVKKGFEFTLMVVGESGLGKSTLVNSLFLTDLYPERVIPDSVGELYECIASGEKDLNYLSLISQPNKSKPSHWTHPQWRLKNAVSNCDSPLLIRPASVMPSTIRTVSVQSLSISTSNTSASCATKTVWIAGTLSTIASIVVSISSRHSVMGKCANSWS